MTTATGGDALDEDPVCPLGLVRRTTASVVAESRHVKISREAIRALVASDDARCFWSAPHGGRGGPARVCGVRPLGARGRPGGALLALRRARAGLAARAARARHRRAAWRGMDPKTPKGGHTNLHCDVSDAVNVMLDVGIDDDAS